VICVSRSPSQRTHAARHAWPRGWGACRGGGAQWRAHPRSLLLPQRVCVQLPRQPPVRLHLLAGRGRRHLLLLLLLLLLLREALLRRDGCPLLLLLLLLLRLLLLAERLTGLHTCHALRAASRGNPAQSCPTDATDQARGGRSWVVSAPPGFCSGHICLCTLRHKRRSSHTDAEWAGTPRQEAYHSAIDLRRLRLRRLS
jgi:hypothetical protein